GYFWGSFPKVTRRKGGTNSSRYPNNGYVPSAPAKTKELNPKKRCVDTDAIKGALRPFIHGINSLRKIDPRVYNCRS
ncbi:hypothetical protein, partial [Pseudomonas gelidaquae]|uniref:hypothetical protein n=2 Tax=unclassified Pseudomonas TaxID=196821 RepID=UPI001C4737EB